MIPLKFEYVEECVRGLPEKRFVTILGEHRHHYTHMHFIRIREEFESGHIQEYMVTDETMKLMLSKRVEAEK